MQVIVVDSIEKGIERAKEVLYREVDSKTALFLSGGKTPKSLYTRLAQEKILKPACVGLIDERYGVKTHVNSNERMIEESGLLSYLSKSGLPFYPILQDKLSRQQTAEKYDQTARNIFFHTPKSMAIFGIGIDGHIAGIPSQVAKLTNEKVNFDGPEFVTSYDVKEAYANFFGSRVTMTFAGLSLLDFMLVFVFGKDKKEPLKMMFTTGSFEEVPARFFNTSEASKKTLIITDQKV